MPWWDDPQMQARAAQATISAGVNAGNMAPGPGQIQAPAPAAPWYYNPNATMAPPPQQYQAPAAPQVVNLSPNQPAQFSTPQGPPLPPEYLNTRVNANVAPPILMPGANLPAQAQAALPQQPTSPVGQSKAPQYTIGAPPPQPVNPFGPAGQPQYQLNPQQYNNLLKWFGDAVTLGTRAQSALAQPATTWNQDKRTFNQMEAATPVKNKAPANTWNQDKKAFQQQEYYVINAQKNAAESAKNARLPGYIPPPGGAGYGYPYGYGGGGYGGGGGGGGGGGAYDIRFYLDPTVWRI